MAPQATATAEVGALALGGNLGAPLVAFARAMATLRAAGGELLAVSRAYLSVAEPSGPNFWNIVCLLRAQGSPEAMLASCQALERAAGRRPGPRWGPRPLDIDLLFWGEARRQSPRLTLPHPRLAGRPFVLWPLAEVALDVPLPLSGADRRTPRQLLMGHRDPLAGILEVHRGWRAGTLDVSRRCG